MKVLLVGNYAPDGQESMLRFGALLRECCSSDEIEIKYVQPKARTLRLVDDARNTHAGIPKFLAYLDKLVIFPLELRKLVRDCDVVHIIDHSNSVYWKSLGSKPWLLTCNDLMAVRSARGEFKESHIGWSGRLLQAWITSCIGRARHIACISHATQDDVHRLIPSTTGRTSVVHMGLSYDFRPEAEVTHGQLPLPEAAQGRKYIMHVGGNQWYKNRVGVVRLFSLLAAGEPDLQLVMAGKAPSDVLQSEIDRSPCRDRIHNVGKVSNQQLQALYHHAEFLVFPSLAEGFGWPIIEAQASGCRVAATWKAPLTEVGGDSCIYLDLDNPEECRSRLLHLLHEDEALRRTRIDAGIKNVRRFTAGQMAESYRALYRELLNESR